MISILRMGRGARHIRRQDSLENAVQRKLEHGPKGQVSRATMGKLIDRVRHAPADSVEQVLQRLKTEGTSAARQMRSAIVHAYRFSDETVGKIESHLREMRRGPGQTTAQQAVLARVVAKRFPPLSQENLLRHTARHGMAGNSRVAEWVRSLPSQPVTADAPHQAEARSVSRGMPPAERGESRLGSSPQRSAGIENKARQPAAEAKPARLPGQQGKVEEANCPPPPPPLPPAVSGDDTVVNAPSGLQAALTQALAKRRQAQEAAPEAGAVPARAAAVPSQSVPRPGNDLMAELAAKLAARAPKSAR